jgi:microcystin-dependent protein
MAILKKLNRLNKLLKNNNYQSEAAPVGSIACFAADLTDNIPKNYLYCNGASLSRAAYAKLFETIGTNWGTASGSTFNIPDMRGYFLRGHADGESVDPDRASRTALDTGGETGDKVGTLQADQNKAHTHDGNVIGPGSGSAYGYYHAAGTSGSSWNTTSSGGNQSNPKNVTVQYYIKYR